MNRLVVGVDGSAAAAAALRWACALAVNADAEILAVHAVQSPRYERLPDESEQLIAERTLELATWIQPAVDAGARIRTSVCLGDPREALHTTAEAEGADLVVLGRIGRSGGPGFLHLGSAVEHAAHHTGRPLAIVPSASSGNVDRIVVGVDGSPTSLQAVEWCVEPARTSGASVIAVAVDEPWLEWTPISSPDNWRRILERKIDDWVAPITAAGVKVEHVAQRDLHPADGLLDVASARDGDMIVVGTRGAGGISNLRAGGVAMKVLHRASLPVVLVPPRV